MRGDWLVMFRSRRKGINFVNLIFEYSDTKRGGAAKRLPLTS
jgi:hypothetical protein